MRMPILTEELLQDGILHKPNFLDEFILYLCKNPSFQDQAKPLCL